MMKLPNRILLLFLFVCCCPPAVSELRAQVPDRFVFIPASHDTVTLSSDDILSVDTRGRWFQVSPSACRRLAGVNFTGGVVLVYSDSILCDVWSFFDYRKATINRFRFIYTVNDTIAFADSGKIRCVGMNWSCSDYMAAVQREDIDLSMKIFRADSLICTISEEDVLSVSVRMMEVSPPVLDGIRDVNLKDCRVELWKGDKLFTETGFLQETGMRRINIRGFFLLGDFLLIVDDRYLIYQRG